MPLQTHIRSPLTSAAPISRLRRARAQEGGTILSQAKFRSAHLDPPELIRPRKIEKGEAFVFRRPLSRLLPAQPRRSHISRRRSAAFAPSVESGGQLDAIDLDQAEIWTSPSGRERRGGFRFWPSTNSLRGRDTSDANDHPARCGKTTERTSLGQLIDGDGLASGPSMPSI